MAREIDVDNLDADQVAYLRQRPWLIEEAKQVHDVEDIEERMAEVEQKEEAKRAKTVEAGLYDELTLKQLRELADSRQLDRSGSKADLISRLQEEDERLAATIPVLEDQSINENPGDSTLGDK